MCPVLTPSCARRGRDWRARPGAPCWTVPSLAILVSSVGSHTLSSHLQVQSAFPFLTQFHLRAFMQSTQGPVLQVRKLRLRAVNLLEKMREESRRD